MREQFIDKRFHSGSQIVIARANTIIDEYSSQGFNLTLRQLYYQFVARDYIPNTAQSYKRLGSILSDARMAGLVDWSAIEDRTRALEETSGWNNPEAIVEETADAYQRRLWDNQPCRVEVWIEKEALAGILAVACGPRRLPYFSCRGNVSQSEQYTAGKRLEAYADRGKGVHVIHLGDHDPSGIDMTRDNRDRLNTFSRHVGVEVHRIALNMDQVEEFSPPPNRAKVTDSRYAGYVDQFGEESWELDAMEPAYLSIIQAKAEDYRRGTRPRSLSTRNSGRPTLPKRSRKRSSSASLATTGSS